MPKIILLIQCFFSAAKLPAIHMFVCNVHFNYYKENIGITHFINLLGCAGLIGKIYISVILTYPSLIFFMSFTCSVEHS